MLALAQSEMSLEAFAAWLEEHVVADEGAGTEE